MLYLDSRFKNDFIYDYCISPQGFDYYSMNKEEADEHFTWFLSKIDERIEYLKSFYFEDTGKTDSLDFSYDSLIELWKWFLDKAIVEEMPKDKYKIQQKQYEAFGQDFISKYQLSVSTEYLIRDIGIYLSEIFKKSSPKIQWHYSTKPKTYFFVNRPMLFGFVNTKYKPPFPCECDPIHLTQVQASKLLDKTGNANDLYNVAVKWGGYISIL